MWILTSEYNDYDQYGQYFEGAWVNLPSPEEIMFHTGDSKDHAEWLIQSGGGRRGYERMWYNLFEHV